VPGLGGGAVVGRQAGGAGEGVGVGEGGAVEVRVVVGPGRALDDRDDPDLVADEVAVLGAVVGRGAADDLHVAVLFAGGRCPVVVATYTLPFGTPSSRSSRRKRRKIRHLR